MSVYGHLYCGKCLRETVHYGPHADKMRCIQVHDETEAKCVKCHLVINLELGRMYVYGNNYCLPCWDEERRVIVEAIHSKEVKRVLEPIREAWERRN